MNNILQAIQTLKNKLEILVSRYELLKAEHSELISENQKLKIKLLKKNEQLNKLEDDLKTLRVARTIEGSENSIKETKLKINTLIREIDKCIIQLNS